jgi:hypothetical protein
MTDWPFDEPEDVAAIAVRQIFDEGGWIHIVSRDPEDGCWQFLGPDQPEEADALVVSLGEVVELDSSLEQLADLPPGWTAWREAPDQPWQRAPQEE